MLSNICIILYTFVFALFLQSHSPTSLCSQSLSLIDVRKHARFEMVCQRQAKALAVPLTCQQVERFCGGTTSLAQAPTAASDVYSGGVAMAKAGHLFCSETRDAKPASWPRLSWGWICRLHLVGFPEIYSTRCLLHVTH